MASDVANVVRTPRNPRRQALRPCVVLSSPDQVHTLGDAPNPDPCVPGVPAL